MKHILCFLALTPPCPKTVHTPLVGADNYRCYKQIQHLKKWDIARNIMCCIINVIIAKEKFSANLIYLSFSKFSYRQNMF